MKARRLPARNKPVQQSAFWEGDDQSDEQKMYRPLCNPKVYYEAESNENLKFVIKNQNSRHYPVSW